MANLSYYPAGEQDYDFLYRLHYLTFYDYVFKTWGMTETAFESVFRAEYENPARRVICLEDEPVGSLVVEQHCDGIFLDYIAILPGYQNRGFGTELIRSVLADAAREQKIVRLHVLKVNPARALYERLGFRVYGEDEFRYYMELP